MATNAKKPTLPSEVRALCDALKAENVAVESGNVGITEGQIDAAFAATGSSTTCAVLGSAAKDLVLLHAAGQLLVGEIGIEAMREDPNLKTITGSWNVGGNVASGTITVHRDHATRNPSTGETKMHHGDISAVMSIAGNGISPKVRAHLRDLGQVLAGGSEDALKD